MNDGHSVEIAYFYTNSTNILLMILYWLYTDRFHIIKD